MYESNGPLENGPQHKEEELPAPIIGHDQAQAAMRLFHLYEGNENSHGQCDVIGFKDNGKAIANVKTHRTPATPELWARHICGTYGLGVVPLHQDGHCSWGCVDIDDYQTDPATIAARVAALRIPALVTVSRSGGKHIFLFARVPVHAAQMRQRLAEAAKALEYPDAECFPKQSDPTECGGNWLNMPWHGGQDSRRYGVMLTGDAYTLAEWLDAAERLKAATGPDWFSAPLSLPSAPESAPGSGQKSKGTKGTRRAFILPDQITEGQRDIILTRYAGTLRRAGVDRDGILAALRLENQKRCTSLMADKDLVRIAGSIGKKEAGAELEDGLIQRMAGSITTIDAFARDAGGLLYHFEDGVYRPTGRRFIEKRVKQLCEEQAPKSWTPELATRVEGWIAVDAPELWERPPLDVLNVRNGLLSVESRTLAPHSKEHLSPIQINVNFDPDAKCPNIDKFIAEVFPADTQHLPGEVMAWLMLPDTSIQKAVLLLGEGANGKSVFLTLLIKFLGKENVSTLSLHKLESDKFAVARLVGKLANLGMDLPTKALAGTSMFKNLTGGDCVSAERKYEASFEFQPFVRLLFSANSAPRSEDSTHGFFRRWLVIPFTRTFDESGPETVPRAVLDARLSQPAELSGLLNRALDALPTIREGRFTESASTRAALEEFRATTDPLAVWLETNTVERYDAMVPKDKLRSLYGQVCQSAGRPIMGEVQFTAALKRLKPKVEPARRRVNRELTQVYVGMGLVIQDPVPEGLNF
jgi:putative DNA primase/helicase